MDSAPTDDVFRSVAGPATVEFKVRGSRFIGEAYPIQDEHGAARRLAEARKTFFDATHRCFAYRLGAAGDRYRVGDDGEPSGTAGQPIYQQIESFGLTDTLVVVIRYFGGTKLGRGGLARAYGEVARHVLERCRIIEHFLRDRFSVSFEYDDTSPAMHTIERFNGEIVATEYTDVTHLTVDVRRSRSHDFEKTFAGSLRGRGSVEKIGG